MTEPAESLLRGALALPKDDRADLAAELLVSLDETTEDDLSDVDEQWARELEARARRALAGRTASEDWVATGTPGSTDDVVGSRSAAFSSTTR